MQCSCAVPYQKVLRMLKADLDMRKNRDLGWEGLLAGFWSLGRGVQG